MRAILLFFALGASLLYSQTQAPDASPDGPFVPNFGGYSAGAAEIDNEVLPGCGFTVSDATWAAKVATLTIGAHGLVVGQKVEVREIIPAGYNVTAMLTAVTATTISFALAANPGAYVSGGRVAIAEYDCKVQVTGEFYVPNPLNGLRPLVVFLHGNHGTCGHAYKPPVDGGTDPPGLPGAPRIDQGIEFTGSGMCNNAANPIVVPNYRGYDYLANKLASWGYIVISIDANRGIGGINAPLGVADDGELIRARGALVLKTLAQLSFWNTNGDVPGSAGALLQGHIDFGNVGLMGHSRGGDGTRAALSLFTGATPTPMNDTEFWPTNPWPGRITGLNIKAIFEIGPTDFDRRFNATGVTWNVLLPMCDGDVFALEGVRPFDRAIMSLEATPLQKSTYTVWGANHNFFNTQWQVTDPFPTAGGGAPSICEGAGNERIYPVSPGSPDQLLVGTSSLVAFMRGNVGAGANIAFNLNFNPPFGIPAKVDGTDYPTRVDRGYSPPGKITVFDDFTVKAFNSTNPAVPHVESNVAANYGTVPDHDPVLSNALNVSWPLMGMAGDAKTYFETDWTPNNKPGKDIRAYKTLDIRVSRERSAVNPAGPSDFSIVLVGANGVTTRSVKLSTYIDPNFAGLAGNESDLTGPVGTSIELHPILQTVRIPLTGFGNFAFIGPQVQGVRLIFDQTPTGAIYVTNIRLSTQIGGGAANYPPIPPPIPEPSVSSRPLVQAQTTAAVPVAHPASIVSITQVGNAPELGGAAGYRILVESKSGAFPLRNERLVMIVGDGTAPPLADPQVFTKGYDPLVAGQKVFTLTTSQFQSLSKGKRVIVQFGEGLKPEYWDCGVLP